MRVLGAYAHPGVPAIRASLVSSRYPARTNPGERGSLPASQPRMKKRQMPRRRPRPDGRVVRPRTKPMPAYPWDRQNATAAAPPPTCRAGSGSTKGPEPALSYYYLLFLSVRWLFFLSAARRQATLLCPFACLIFFSWRGPKAAAWLHPVPVALLILLCCSSPSGRDSFGPLESEDGSRASEGSVGSLVKVILAAR